MTCEDCVNKEQCEIKSKTDKSVDDRMYLVEFWRNAEIQCTRFKEKEK